MLLEEEAMQIPCFMHSINDIEKTGDYSEAILDLGIKKTDLKITFSKKTEKKIKKIIDLLFAFEKITAHLKKHRTNCRKRLQMDNKVKIPNFKNTNFKFLNFNDQNVHFMFET